jgi:hypothetical protein
MNHAGSFYLLVIGISSNGIGGYPLIGRPTIPNI